MKDLDVKLVRAFVEVARELSFTHASLRSGIAQPRLSLRVQALEEILQVKLFSRTSRSVALTAPGQRFLVPANRIIAAVDDAIAIVREVQEAGGERLQIGATAFRVSQRWTILQEFRSAYPEVDLRVTAGPSPELVEKVRMGGLEMAFVLGPVPGGVSAHLVSADRIGLTVPASSPLATSGIISIDQLRRQTLAMFPSAPNLALHREIRKRLAAQDITLIDPPELTAEAMTQFVRDVGIGIVSAQWWSPEHTLGLAYLEIAEITETLDLYLVRSAAPLSSAGEALWRVVGARCRQSAPA